MVDARTWISRAALIGIPLSLSLSLACAGRPPDGEIDPFENSPRQRAMVDAIAAALAGPMKERSPEEALLVEREDLYAPLTIEQRNFLEAIRHIEGADPTRAVASENDWIRIEDRRVRGPSGERVLSLQLLPRRVGLAFRRMDAAMRADLGRGLLIGSGYRTPANQLFIFVSYMPYYDYSPTKTLLHVSLPGASDHNRVERQGIDFVSEEGVDLRYSDAEAFRALDEYAWLVANAARFGFEDQGPGGLSPWHWHFIDEP